MTTLARKGGFAASIVLVVLGVAAMVIGVVGRDTVRDDLAREQIVGTPDSTIPGQKDDSGSEAKEFAAVMRKHTLEATGGQPVENPSRNIWISSTAFQTALNTAYFAESVATFVIVMGAALLLVGIGFLVLSIRLLKPELGVARGSHPGATAATAS